MVSEYCFLRKDGSLLSSWEQANSIRNAVRARCGVNSLAVIHTAITCTLFYRKNTEICQQIIQPYNEAIPVDFCSCDEHSILLDHWGRVRIDGSEPQDLPPVSYIAAGKTGCYAAGDGKLRFCGFESHSWKVLAEIPEGTEIETYGDIVRIFPAIGNGM